MAGTPRSLALQVTCNGYTKQGRVRGRRLSMQEAGPEGRVDYPDGEEEQGIKGDLVGKVPESWS